MSGSGIESAQFGPASYVVCALGDLEAQSTSLRSRLMPLADIEDARVVLDVGGAYGIGDAAVAVIVEVAETLGARRGARLVIVASDPWVKRQLASAGVDALARIETTLMQGLAYAAA